MLELFLRADKALNFLSINCVFSQPLGLCIRWYYVQHSEVVKPFAALETQTNDNCSQALDQIESQK